ncbi:hypothetical protein MRX96_002929 [Rhipicephalus microplus]
MRKARVVKTSAGQKLLDGRPLAWSNWMRYVNTATSEQQHNLVAFEHSGALYYKTCRAVGAFEELLLLDEAANPGKARASGAQKSATLRQVFQKLRDNGLRLNKAKCRFREKEVQFLGHMIDANGLHPLRDNLEAVTAAPRPASVSQLKSTFLENGKSPAKLLLRFEPRTRFSTHFPAGVSACRGRGYPKTTFVGHNATPNLSVARLGASNQGTRSSAESTPSSTRTRRPPKRLGF